MAKKPDKNTYNWENAIKYCNDLHTDNFSDWVLPSINDLENIIGKEKLFDAYKINYWYWSSTSLFNNDAEAWHIGSNMHWQKKRESYKSFSLNVRCVRDSKSVNQIDSKLVKPLKNNKIYIITDSLANLM